MERNIGMPLYYPDNEDIYFGVHFGYVVMLSTSECCLAQQLVEYMDWLLERSEEDW